MGDLFGALNLVNVPKQNAEKSLEGIWITPLGPTSVVFRQEGATVTSSDGITYPARRMNGTTLDVPSENLRASLRSNELFWVSTKTHMALGFWRRP